MSTNFDLSTLNLADGSYTVTIVAKGMNLKDSEQSAAASYVVEPSTVTLAAGTYVGNATISYNSKFTQSIAFSSNNVSYTSMSIQNTGDGINLLYINANTQQRAYHITDFVDDPVGWVSTNYKTIKFDTDQTVSTEFSTWFNDNFSPKTYTVQVTKSGAGTFQYSVDDNEPKSTSATSTFSVSNIKEKLTIVLPDDYKVVSGYTFSGGSINALAVNGFIIRPSSDNCSIKFTMTKR